MKYLILLLSAMAWSQVTVSPADNCPFKNANGELVELVTSDLPSGHYILTHGSSTTSHTIADMGQSYQDFIQPFTECGRVSWFSGVGGPPIEIRVENGGNRITTYIRWSAISSAYRVNIETTIDGFVGYHPLWNGQVRSETYVGYQSDIGHLPSSARSGTVRVRIKDGDRNIIYTSSGDYTWTR